MADEQGFKIASAFVTVEPDATDFKEKLKAAIDEAVAGTDATVPIKADLADFDAKVDEAKGKLDDLKSYDATPKLGLDSDEFDTGTDDAKAKLDDLDGKEARAKATLDKDDLDAGIDDAKAKLDDLDAKHADPSAGLDTADFDAKLAAAKASLSAFGSSSANPSLGGSGGGSGGGSEGGGMLAGITGGVAALMPGLGGAATGLGLLGATGAMAFGGVAKAVSAAHSAATNIGETQQQLAATEFSNSVAIRQAQQALGSAHLQAAQDAQQAAMQISQSQMTLAETERNASASMVAAEQAVGQAEHSLADAQFTEQQAQVSLTEARIQARMQLQQLQDQVKDAALSEQAASLAVQQAKYQQVLTDQNAYSTSLDRQQASLAVSQAEQQLTEATQNKANVTTEASKKDRQYFDGQQQLIQAQHAQQDAIWGVTQAQQQLADANTALRNTELNNATAIKEAQMAVRSAEENAAYTAERDALAVKQAQQNVTDTLKEQKLAYAATMASANQSALQYAKDMARLTPAGRGMVREILSLRGAFHGMISAAQSAVAPGMDAFLHGLKSLMPDITSGVRRMGEAIGSAFGQFGKMMDTRSFRDTLNGLIRNGIQFASTVLPAVAQFVQELAKIGSFRGASSGLANLLAGLMRGLSGMAKIIGQNEGAFNQLLTAIGKILTAAGPALGGMLSVFVKILAPIMRFLNSKAGHPFVTMLGSIVAGMLAWKLASKAVIGPLEGIFKLPDKIGKGWTKVFGPKGIAQKVWDFGSKVGGTMMSAGRAVGSFVADYAAKIGQAAIATGTWIAEHAEATLMFIAQNIAQAASATAAFIAENAATLGIVAGIAILVAAVVELATHWHEVWTNIKNWAEDAWHFIYDGFGKWLLPLLGPVGLIALGVIELAQHWNTVWNAIKSTVETVWDGIKISAGEFVAGLKSVWSGLEKIFETPVNFLIGTVYDKGIARLWNDVVSHIGLGSIKLPVIPQLAGGGVLPGYKPGHDTIPAMLSPGEGVLTPQATRGLGGEHGIGAINKHFSGSSGGHGGIGHSLAKMPVKEIARRVTERPALHAATFGHFASGGVAGSKSSGGGGGFLGFLGGLGHDILSGISGAVDIAKIVAAVATGNTTAFTNAASKLIGTSAAGDLGKMMIGVPKTLVEKAAQELTGMVSGSGGGVSSPGHVTGTVAEWFARAVKLTGVGSGWIPDLETIARYESSDNPNAINLTDSNAAAGDPSRGIMQTIMSTFLAYHQPGTSMNIFDPVANISAAIRYIKSRYGTVGDVPGILSLAHGGGYVGYDSGGWLMPSGMMPGAPVNMTGQPEAVLTPQQSQALVRLAQSAAVNGGHAGAQVNVNFLGTQYPNAEQMAAIKREMALALSGP